jgi:hypothetical protein
MVLKLPCVKLQTPAAAINLQEFVAWIYGSMRRIGVKY